MALRFIDSFDHYATANLLSKGYTTGGTPTISAGNGRNGTSSLRGNPGDVTKTIDSQATWIFGFGFRFQSPPASDFAFFKLLDGATLHVDLRLTPSMTLRATRNGTSLGLGTAVLTAGVYYYIEVKITINDTTGVFVVKVNGVTDINLSSQDTRNAANSTADRFTLNMQTNMDFDDLYACDGTGSAPTNDFLGDCRVEAILPSGAGNYAQWTPSTGSNYQNVDDATPNSDTDYNSSSTPGQKDSFAFGNITPSSATIYGIQHNLFARKDDAGTRTIRPLQRQSSTDYAGTSVNLSTTYTYYTEVKEQNPATSAAWTVSDVNTNAEFGYEEVA